MCEIPARSWGEPGAASLFWFILAKLAILSAFAHTHIQCAHMCTEPVWHDKLLLGEKNIIAVMTSAYCIRKKNQNIARSFI